MARTTIRTEDITASEVTTAKMATDPTNASNLSSGSVPTAQLGNVDTSGLRNDISTLALHSAIADNKAAFNLTNAFVDQYEDSTGIDVLTDCQRNTSGEYVASTVAASETYHPNAGGIANSYGSQASTVTGTNNETATLKSISSGGSALMNDQAGKTRGVFTLITELVQAGQYAGAHAYGYAVVKNTDSLDNPPYSDDDALGYPNTSMNGMSVGNKIKVVYDTDNENVLTHYVDTGSGYGSAITTVNSAGPDYESTTLVTPYFYIVAWSDTAQPWILTCSGTRDYSDVNATGNYTSTTETANATVSKMGVVVLYKNAYGTATLDTDLIVQVSADGGSNYTSAPLTAAGTFSTGILSAKSNDITISNTGTAPKYKISFANQSVGVKETQVHGVALLYQDGHNMSYVGNKPAQTTIPVDDSVTTAMLKDDAVTSAKIDDGTIATADIADDAVTVDKVANAINTSIAANTAKVTNATHTGDVTGATALTIATDAVDIAMLSATGTADATTFLRGDNAWAAPAGGDNTPSFQARNTSNQTSLTSSTFYKIEYDTEDWDTDSAYDNSTNYRFTVPAGEGGKYYFHANCDIYATGNGSINQATVKLYVNGSAATPAGAAHTFWDWRGSSGGGINRGNFFIDVVLSLSAADYVEVYMTVEVVGAAAWQTGDQMGWFTGYKLIGV